MAATTEKTSADIQREIEEDRLRIGNRIEAIQERMSPGQLVDEVLAYAKTSGGGEYVSNLGRAVKTNPLPVALVGVGLAWLMAKQGSDSPTPTEAGTASGGHYPLYEVDGPVRRIGPPEEADGSRYSHFTDNSGKRLRALTDAAGRRAGHFIDEAGKSYRGFVDASGRRIEQIADETGSYFDSASGWASESWDNIKNATSQVQDQAGRLNETILKHFKDQPLVGGALAFAAGAAIGAALPHSEPEDRVFGASADKLRNDASDKAEHLLHRASHVASDTYGSVVSVAADVHDDIKDRVKSEFDNR